MHPATVKLIYSACCQTYSIVELEEQRGVDTSSMPGTRVAVLV